MAFNPIADLDSALWNEQNPRLCPCRGSGWLLSDYDTWHRCCTHGNGVPHPEDDETEFDFEAHRVKIQREAFVAFRRMAREAGFKGHFRKAVEGLAKNDSPEALVDAAEALGRRYAYAAAEVEAHRLGYSCALEQRLDEDAEREAYERRYGIRP